MRAYQDLREFLSVLEQERQLLRIADPVKLEPDLAAAACALTKLGESSPAILFNNISGYAISVMTGSLPTAIRPRQVYATRLGMGEMDGDVARFGCRRDLRAFTCRR